MEWDLGPMGIGLLLVMSVVAGGIAQLIAARMTTPWVGVIVGVTYFVAGLLISEVWFGWATAAELQPNIDGLSFDEVLLIGWLPAIGALLVTWLATRRSHHRPMTP
jgi:hypothetical protein